MKKTTLLVSGFLVLALFLAACGPADDQEFPAEPGLDGSMGDPAPGEIPGISEDPATEAVEPPMDETIGATATVPGPVETDTVPTTPFPADETPAPTQPGTGTGDAALRGAQVIPETGREDATMLSKLLGYQIVVPNGTTIGSVDDYILNLCEAHIVYVVLEAAPSIELEDGNLVVFPYEMVTLQEGVIDVDQRVITVNVDAEQFADGPSVGERLDLTTTEWEDDIRNHWSEVGRLSNLSTVCPVPASTGTEGAGRQEITRIAYAMEVMDMRLLDGNGNLIGEVEEVLVEPESGWLPYMAIRPNENLQTDGGLVLVPFGALNLDTSGGGATQDQNLVLLVEPEVLENAPTVDSLPADGMDGSTFDYWSQHVPMTREELP